MKFKFMGMKMNTLYVILALLVILGIAYLYLKNQKATVRAFSLTRKLLLELFLG